MCYQSLHVFIRNRCAINMSYINNVELTSSFRDLQMESEPNLNFRVTLLMYYLYNY